MAGYSVNPGPFKAVAADPEGTMERLEDYCRTMEMVFRLSRRVTSTGTKIDFDDSEKKDMIQIEGGEDMMQLFRFVGKVQDTDTYQQAITKIKTALKKTGNRTSAVHRLYTAHSQGDQTFDTWHRTVRKAAQLIDWTDYDADKATVDAILMQTSSSKLRQRAIQENLGYEELVALGISQEQATKKSERMPDAEKETVGRLKQENKALKQIGLRLQMNVER